MKSNPSVLIHISTNRLREQLGTEGQGRLSMEECLGGTAKVRWSEAQTFFGVRSLSAEVKHSAVPLAIPEKPSRLSVLWHW